MAAQRAPGAARSVHLPAGARREGLFWLPACLGLFALALLPVLLSPLPPLQDYINHLARMHVIAAAGRDPLLDRFYAIDWKIVPNLAMDLAVPPLARLIGLEAAGKMLLLACLGLLLTGPQAVHYALFRRLSLGPLVAVLFIYNQMVAWGFVNYLLGVGLALWGLAAWIALRPPLLRGAVSLAVVVVLFFCHLAAVGLYAVAVFAFEAWAACVRPGAERGSAPARLLALALPFLVVPALLAFSPTGDVPLHGMRWLLRPKIEGLWAIFRGYDATADKIAAIVIVGAALWAWTRGIFRLHAAGWFILAALVPLYLALPHEMMSGSAVDNRLPIGALFILIGFIEWRLPTLAAQHAFLCVVAAIAVGRMGATQSAWWRLDAVAAEFQRSLPYVAPGSKVLVAEADLRSPFSPLRYLPCLAMIERSSMVSLAFANPRQHILRVKPPFDAMTNHSDVTLLLDELLDPESIEPDTSLHPRLYWRDWRERYDYLYVMWTEDQPNPAPGLLDEVYAGDAFRLYRIKHAGPPATAALP